MHRWTYLARFHSPKMIYPSVNSHSKIARLVRNIKCAVAQANYVTSLLLHNGVYRHWKRQSKVAIKSHQPKGTYVFKMACLPSSELHPITHGPREVIRSRAEPSRPPSFIDLNSSLVCSIANKFSNHFYREPKYPPARIIVCLESSPNIHQTFSMIPTWADEAWMLGIHHWVAEISFIIKDDWYNNAAV